METNPYQPPVVAQVAEVHSDDVPHEVLKKIKNGFVAAMFSGLMTLGVTLFFVFSDSASEIFDAWNFIDVGLIFLLAFGIYRKSRAAATFMFLYFLASKIWLMILTGAPQGLIISLIFLYFYFQAMVGTFQYHRFLKSNG